MHTAITLVFSAPAFQNSSGAAAGRPVYLVEEELYFNQYNFHKKKLVLHRAAMKAYAQHLQNAGVAVHYIEAKDEWSSVAKLVSFLAEQNVSQIDIADVADDWLLQRLTGAAQRYGIRVTQHRTPQFLNSLAEAESFFESRQTYRQSDFYIDQRKRRGILLEGDGPLGGRWTYDEENRLKLPKGAVPPPF